MQAESTRGETEGQRWLCSVVAALFTAAAVVFYVAWEAAHRTLTGYATTVYQADPADEWRYTACSSLVRHGYSLFTQVFSAQPPLLFFSLATGMRLFGETIQDARWVEIGFGLVSLLCVAWIGWLLFGPVAGGAGAFLLAVSPGFLVYSHAIEAEGPMMALMTLSMALVVVYYKSGRRFLPVLAGLALAGAILIKLFALEALLPALWLLFCAPGRSRTTPTTAALGPFALARDKVEAGGTFVAGALLPLVIELLLLHPAQQWDQVITLHEKTTPHFSQATSSLTILKNFFTLDIGLTLLALGGFAALLLLNYWREALFLALWVGGTTVMLLAFHPLFSHHPPILLTGLAVVAGAGLGAWIRAIQRLDLRILFPVAGLLVYVVFVPRLVHADQQLVRSEAPSLATELAWYVDLHTRPGDFVAADDVEVADVAKRLEPPQLCDPSRVRLAAGYLSARELIAATKQYRVKLVVASFGTYGQVPEYMSWLRAHYKEVTGPGGSQIFVR